jgi:hypothetical protein
MISRVNQQVARKLPINLVPRYIGEMPCFLRVQFSRILKIVVEL